MPQFRTRAKASSRFTNRATHTSRHTHSADRPRATRRDNAISPAGGLLEVAQRNCIWISHGKLQVTLLAVAHTCGARVRRVGCTNASTDEVNVVARSSPPQLATLRIVRLDSTVSRIAGADRTPTRPAPAFFFAPRTLPTLRGVSKLKTSFVCRFLRALKMPVKAVCFCRFLDRHPRARRCPARARRRGCDRIR